MGLAFIPTYIRYLGMEAYGLIGLFAALQAWLTLLDMGMTPTLNREMARYTAGAHSAESIQDLLRSMEILCVSIGILIFLGAWAASGFLANNWLQPQKLQHRDVAQALSIMAFVVSLRFVEGIYRGSLYGLQRQVWYNGVGAILATLRHGGAVAILAWGASTVQAFFIWQGVISLLTLSVYARSVHRLLPKAPLPPRFSLQAVAGVWKFASGMLGITFLALLLTQVDKVILSRMLSLAEFGDYTLAATLAGAIGVVISPITLALFPRMVELGIANDQLSLNKIYHQGAQLITILTAPAVLLLVFFAPGVVFMWSGNVELSVKVSPMLSALALGTFLNGLMWMPYQCQLAFGWTSLTLKTNIVAVAFLIPAIVFIVPRYGGVGAAWIWVILNASYIIFHIHFMHRRLILTEKWIWYFYDLLLPVGGALGVIVLAYGLRPDRLTDRWSWFVFLLMSGGLAFAAAVLSCNQIRPRVFVAVKRAILSVAMKYGK